MPAYDQIPVGKVHFHALSYGEALGALLQAARTGTALPVRLSNAWCVVMAHDSPAYASVLNGPGMTLPDGKPVAAAMRRRRPDIQLDRVRGPSFFRSVLRASQETGLAHYFLGGTPESLDAMVKRIKVDYPGVRVAGQWSPPFGPVDDEMVERSVRMVKGTQPDIVWIGLGSPKQDFLSSELAARIGRPCVGVGAAFDFVAGTVSEAPGWMQRFGLEWLHRLASEPKRLWKRYLIGNIRFVKIALRS